MNTFREIVLEPAAQAALDAAVEAAPGVGEVWRGLEWRLSRNPSAGRGIHRIHSTNLHVLHTLPWPGGGAPEMVILYTFDQDSVSVKGIQVVEP